MAALQLAEAGPREVPEQNAERMADVEHDGWTEHRARNGRRYDATRDDAKMLHRATLPYAKLLKLNGRTARNETASGTIGIS